MEDNVMEPIMGKLNGEVCWSDDKDPRPGLAKDLRELTWLMVGLFVVNAIFYFVLFNAVLHWI
jgi:hypothetical protein